ncbi:hypothetical protein LTR56_027308 [Elasticomyces elasticus]|nr:hypothetical protein LTR56_027308 [Elasticomyces elasticus]KAK3615571.1 hypothetical protein LTR22_027381 [Elasticomyces elasticus]KAK4908196.1 hypothetical protein LTR49_022882 [Elasticomyces elasticus]
MATDRLLEWMAEIDDLEWGLLDITGKMRQQRDALLEEMMEEEREAQSDLLEKWMSESDRLFLSRSPLNARLG